ncbi:MAG: hypothetical protein AAF585_25815 [Verrucomicrobiota bacterium]
MSTIIKAVVALAVLWGIVFGVMWMAGVYEVTPEKVRDYVEANPIQEMEDADDREAHIRKLAEMFNQLEPDERPEARRGGGEDEDLLWKHLTPAERALMVELTMNKFFTNMMKRFNEMDPEERKRIAERTIRQLQDGDQMQPPEQARLEEGGVELFEKVMSEGVRAYYQDASAETKIDFAPVLEELQSVMQNPRRWKGNRVNYHDSDES